MKKVYTAVGVFLSVMASCSGILPAFGDMPVAARVPFWLLFILFNFLPSPESLEMKNKKLKQCLCGAGLLSVYLWSSIACLVIWIPYLFTGANPDIISAIANWLITLLLIFAAMSLLYWNGTIRIMLFSTQVGIFYKGWSYFIGWLFPINLAVIPGIIKKAREEALFENNKILVNGDRTELRVCCTKYPLLMVHGVFFRDFKPAFLNYWGRITGELIQNGATVFTGNQQSAASVENCGRELADRIRQIVAQTGCEKVNIIAHSKGGLDSRAAIARYGVEDMVASLTTINTPHRGCEFADYLLGVFGQDFKDKVAGAYNAALSKLGDQDPNFIEAVTDLTHEACTNFNAKTPDSSKVYYQSVGTCMRHASGGKFPLNFSYHLVKHFDGRNDGLVGEKSFGWGQKFTFIEPKTDRGISHGDMIDLNRENIDGFDVREFYVQLVNDLKNRGF